MERGPRLGEPRDARLYHRRVQEPDRLAAPQHGLGPADAGPDLRRLAGQRRLAVVQRCVEINQ